MLLDSRKNCPSCGMLAIPYKETGNEDFHNKLKGAAVSHSVVLHATDNHFPIFLLFHQM